MGGGSAQVRAPHQVSIAEGLTERLGDGLDGRRRGRGADPCTPAARPGSDPVTGRAGLRVRVYSERRDLLTDGTPTEAARPVGHDDELAEPAHRVVLDRDRAGGCAGRSECSGVGTGTVRDR